MINPSIKANLAAHGHDQRIDLVRGIAIWFLLLDHIPHNIVNLLTLRNFGFSGAADLFVFVSGYAAAILFGKMTLERGFVVTTSQIIKRVGKLYAAHLVMFVIYLNTIGWVAARYGTTDIIEQYHVIGILNDPVRVLMHGLLLLAKPLNLDVLQLLITLLAFFPFALRRAVALAQPDLGRVDRAISRGAPVRYRPARVSQGSRGPESVLLAAAVRAGRLVCLERPEIWCERCGG